MMCMCTPRFFFFSSSAAPRDLHSFPTRRSSDLLPRHLEVAQQDVGPPLAQEGQPKGGVGRGEEDRKSTRLNSSHTVISYAVFCLKKKKKTPNTRNHHPSGRIANSWRATPENGTT